MVTYWEKIASTIYISKLFQPLNLFFLNDLGTPLFHWHSCSLNLLKVSENPFNQNKNTFKNIKVLLYTHFYNISLNVIRPTFFNICNLPFSHFPNISKIRVKIAPKTKYYSYFLSSCTVKIIVFNNFLSLLFSQPRDKQNCTPNFLLFKYFLSDILLTIFKQNTLSKLVELLQ